jgi:hypothetical protein
MQIAILFFAAAVHSLLGPNPEPPAYLDPGTGSYLLQLIIAGLVGGAFLVKAFWGRITAFIKKIFTGRKSDEHNQE